MNRVSRILVLASLLVATALEVRLAARELGQLLVSCEIAFAVAFLAALWWPRAVAALALVFTYTAPVLLAVVIGRYRQTYTLVWIAAMLGAIAASRPLRGWAFPPRWRWPLVAWAIVIAATWPIVVWRETDFDLSLLSNYRVSNTSHGVAPPVAVVGILDSVVTQGLGLLWFDWLYDRLRSEPLWRFDRFVAVPLAASALLACLLGTYQGFIDITFWSGGLWPVLRRAAGGLVDANASGMIAACWGPAFVAVALQCKMRGRALVAVAGLAVAWSGLWASGSRTALLAGCLGLAFVLAALVGRVGRLNWRWWTVAVGAPIALAILLFMLLPARTIGPIRRLLSDVASPGAEGLSGLMWGLWERNAYGSAATQVIREMPFFGVGVGAFTLLSVDYAWLATGNQVPFDNAQNWFRHQFAELGLIGSVGWIAWVVLFFVVLLRTRGDTERRLPAAAIKGALVGFTAASMLGVAAMNTAVTLTFWTFAFWYIVLAVPREEDERPSSRVLSRPLVAWTLIWVLVAACVAGTYTAGRRDLLPANRAKRIGWDYHYGLYNLETGLEGAYRWTQQKAVAVIPVRGRTLKLDAWTNDPEISQQPVEFKVWIDSTLVVDTRLRDGSHVTTFVPMPSGDQRVVVRTWVSRTWRPSDHGSADKRELGVAVADWTFVERPPGQADRDGPAKAGPYGWILRPPPDRRVVLIREHPLVQSLHVAVERGHELEEPVGRAGVDAEVLGRRRDRLQLVGDRRAIGDLDAREPARLQQVLQRLGMQRSHVREIADVTLEKRHPARRVDRLEHEVRTRPELVERRLQQAHQVVRLQMLHDLHGQQPAQRLVG